MDKDGFANVKTIDEYMKDVNGKYQYCYEYETMAGRTHIGWALTYFLCEHVRTKTFQTTIRDYYENNRRIKKAKFWNRLPSFEFKNLKARYKNVSFYVSNKAINNEINAHDFGVRSYLILSFDTVMNMREFILEDAFKFYNNIENELDDDKTKIFTFDDGYWEISKQNKHRSKDTIFIDNKIHENLFEKVEQFTNSETKGIYNRLGIPYKLNILLYGPPGTGKSSMIEVIASKYNRNIRYMHITPKLTDTDFAKGVSRLDDEDILVCEDIDCLFVERKQNDKHKNSMSFSGLLNAFDGITGCKDGLIIFLTTNYKCNLDTALLRPGRVDLMEEFSYMNEETLRNMIKFYFENKYQEDDFNKFYNYVKEENITGAIMSNFLLELLLKKDYELYKNRKKIMKLLKDNNYEKSAQVTQQLYA